MDADHADAAASSIAAAIGAPARARMLFCLVDGRARTSTELAVVADVTASTASIHLKKLEAQQLVRARAQGRHRYYSLGGDHVAAALEALSVVAGGDRPRQPFVPTTPHPLRAARTCYDHIAGRLGVALHDRLAALRWLATPPGRAAYELTSAGERGVATLGIDLDATRALRRRFAFPCVDWSERRPHLGGALGAALLDLALTRAWVSRERDSRALRITLRGRRDPGTHLGLSTKDVGEV